ncbi:restriction endonuclease subunit S [Streptomyces sp. NPDC046985]|uniref:restriction endonuclease subunit S n=1 Tax=Streptomyces sp. NPDC046985 TaxID=3155377 RepID=UPI0033CEE5D4
MSEGRIPSELSEGWAWAKLAEVVDVLDSLRVPVSAKERASRHGDVPYYGAAGQVGWIDEKIFNEDLILLGEDGVQFFDITKTKAYAISGPAWVNNHAHVLRASKGGIYWKYLIHYLNYFNYEGFANGTTRLKLTKAAMLRIPLPIPPLEEQWRIVSALEEQLSRLDAAEKVLHDSARRIERYIQVSLHRMTSNYRTVHLRDVLTGGLTNGRSVPTRAGGFPVLRLTALSGPHANLARRKDGDWEASEAEPFLVKPGDFLISRGNGSVSLVGRGSLVSEVEAPVAYPDTMIRARPNIIKICPDYLRIIWSSPHVRQQIERRARTTAGIHKVNQKILGAVEFPLPDLLTQKKISAEWSELEQKAGRLSRSVSASKHHSTSVRRSLLAEAFAGRLVPQDLADEPAEALLARVRAEREAEGTSKVFARRAPAARKPRSAPAPETHPPPQANTPASATQPPFDLEFPS